MLQQGDGYKKGKGGGSAGNPDQSAAGTARHSQQETKSLTMGEEGCIGSPDQSAARKDEYNRVGDQIKQGDNTRT